MGRKRKEDIQMSEEVVVNFDDVNKVAGELLDAIEQETKKEFEANLEDVSTVPCPTDPEWSDYILSQFLDSEVMINYDKKTKLETGRYPRVHGLRRLARKHLGEIIESYPIAVNVTYAPNDGFCGSCFIYTVIFSLKTGGTLKYADVGEVLNTTGNSDFTNIDSKFGRFPSAIAATRAEARALRKALGLNVIAAEEFDKTETPGSDGPSYITAPQKSAITVFCKRLEINLPKYIKTGLYNYDDIDKVSFSHAANMWKQLESFQRETKELEKYKTLHNLAV